MNLETKIQNETGIKIDLGRDSLFTELGKTRLRDSYMKDDEETPQHRFARVSKKFSSDPEHSQRLYDYVSKHWLSYSTPILSYGRNKKGLPISCYLNFLSDTSEGLVDTLSETNWLSMMGGGVGVHVGIRGSDEKSVGVMPHLKVYDASSLAYKQGTTRRGSYAAYLDIDHPDIIQFIEMRKPTGDPNMRTLNLHHAVNISDSFMKIIEQCMIDPDFDDSWELKQPNTGKVVEVVSAKYLWQKILEIRMQTGEPYLWFIDTANAGIPKFQKKLGLKNNGSNLCLTGDTIIRIQENNTYFRDIRLDEFVAEFSSNKDRKFKVVSYNGEDTCYSEVTAAAKTGEANILIKIVTEAGTKITCTPDHKILTQMRGWVPANELRKNDILPNSNMKDKYIQEIYTIYLENPVPVYDITVPETECFLANGIVVHNCSEISLATSEDRTAVCCLSSVNLEYYDDWKDDPNFLSDILEMLDNVLTVFITEAPDQISKARFSAMRERSVGVGAMGFHAYLQKNSIPFESALAKSANLRMFKYIKTELDKSNVRLAQERGPCPDAASDGKMIRMAHVAAIAPTASSSLIMGGTSPSIEPYAANAYRQDTTSGAYFNKNRFLDEMIRKQSQENKNPEEWYNQTWASIISNDGSVQHLDWMDDYTKSVFKTAFEIDQRWIIEHAGDRQPYIDQAQSVNLFFLPNVNIKYLHGVHYLAWRLGLKSLYYCRSTKIRRADKVGQSIERRRIEDEFDMREIVEEPGCLACGS